MFATTEELEKAQKKIRSLEEEVEKAKEHATGMAKLVPNTTELVALVNTQTRNELVASTPPINNNEHEQEVETLREELAAQEVLLGRERDQKKAVEEEKRKI